jgi:hypothetical protein
MAVSVSAIFLGAQGDAKAINKQLDKWEKDQ